MSYVMCETYQLSYCFGCCLMSYVLCLIVLVFCYRTQTSFVVFFYRTQTSFIVFFYLPQTSYVVFLKRRLIRKSLSCLEFVFLVEDELRKTNILIKR